jgi:hypothetical protein
VRWQSSDTVWDWCGQVLYKAGDSKKAKELEERLFNEDDEETLKYKHAGSIKEATHIERRECI